MTHITYPKTKYVRSEALMKAYRSIPCSNCGADDGTVCGAHSNQAAHGKGRGLKSSDDMCASLCYTCHTALDQGPASRELKQQMWQRCHEDTMTALIQRSWEDHKLRSLLKKVGIVK